MGNDFFDISAISVIFSAKRHAQDELKREFTCQRDEAKRIRKNFRRYSEYLLRTEGEIDCLGISFETFEYLESLELLDLEALDSTGEKKWVSLS